MTWNDPAKLGGGGGPAWWAYHRARVTLWRDLACAGVGQVMVSSTGESQLVWSAHNGTRKGNTTKPDPWEWWADRGVSDGLDPRRIPWDEGVEAAPGVPESYVRRFAGRLRLVGVKDGVSGGVDLAQTWVAESVRDVWRDLQIGEALERYAGVGRTVAYCIARGGNPDDFLGNLYLVALDALETFQPDAGCGDPLPVQWGRYLARCVTMTRKNYVRTNRPWESLDNQQHITGEFIAGDARRTSGRSHERRGVPCGYGIVAGDVNHSGVRYVVEGPGAWPPGRNPPPRTPRARGKVA